MQKMKWSLLLLICLGCLGCSLITESLDGIILEEQPEVRYFSNPPLNAQWHDTGILDYRERRFPFPPPAGYKVIQFVNHVNNVSMDIHRELIDIDDSFPDIINRRRKADHCKLAIDEKTSEVLPKGVEMLAATGDCYAWHRGEYRYKYYFFRVGYVVFTFRLIGGTREFGNSLTEFDNFVNYAVKDYLIYPAEEKAVAQEYAYPISREELISFLQPAMEIVKAQSQN